MPLTTYTAGEVLTAASLNANFSFAASATTVAIFNETQANNTSAGTFTSGSYVKRVLNTTVVNQITSCTLTSSVISLPAGTYKVFLTAPAMQVGRHQTRLRNTTDSTDIALGSSEFSNNGIDDGCTISNLQTVFTLTATKNIEVQHRCEVTENTFGLGLASNFGNNEIYTQITITKLS